LLDGFVREQKENIMGMCLTEFNEEIAIQNWRQDGIIEGAAQKAVEAARNLYTNGVSVDIIAKSLNMTEEQVKEIVAQPAPAN